MTDKLTRLIESLKAHDWHGELEEDDDIVHLSAGRGDELIDVWLQDGRLMMPAEHSVNGNAATYQNTVTLRKLVIETQPFATAAKVRREKLSFVPEEDDDATIVDALLSRKVYCASLIAPDMPLVEHYVPADRIHKPKVVRFSDGRINLDYLTDSGFRSLRVNNIVKVR